MALETVTYPGDLVKTNPANTDQKQYGDDHIRNIKKALLYGFAGFSGSILVTGTDGGSANTYTVTTGETLPGYVDRTIVLFLPTIANTGACTLNIDGLGAKSLKSVSGAALVLGDLVASVPYMAVYNSSGSGEFRLLSPTENYALQLAYATALPAQTGNLGKFITTDGTSASWSALLLASVLRWADGTDTTKRAAFDLSSITTGTTRTIYAPDRDVTLGGFSNLVVKTATGTWTPPAGITKARITVVDGGTAGNNAAPSDGGAGGDTGISVVTVNPAVTYTATVGAGGSVPAGAGGASSFSGSGLTTVDTTSAQLVIKGAAGGLLVGANNGLGGGTALSGGGKATTGYGCGGNGNQAGSAGIVIIEY